MTTSTRIKRIVDLCKSVKTAADIGADHGLTSAALLWRGLAERIIASDISEKSIAKAQALFSERSLADKTECRVGDGIQVLQPGEAEGIVISGMGGQMILHILQDRPEVVRKADWLVISPQSNVDLVRSSLAQMHLCIEEEDIVEEDGKYYPIMRIVPAQAQAYTSAECFTGKPELMRSKERFLEYMEYMINKFQTIVDQAQDSPELPRLQVRLDMYKAARQKGMQL